MSASHPEATVGFRPKADIQPILAEFDSTTARSLHELRPQGQKRRPQQATPQKDCAIPCDRAHGYATMMNAKACRAKATDALMRAAEATSPDVKAIYSTHAREWTALAVTAEAQEAWDRKLL